MENRCFWILTSLKESLTKQQLKAKPSEVGKKLVGYIANQRFGWRYQKVCTYYGSLIFAEAIHDPNISETIRNGYAPFYWGRGNGWAAAAMVEVLPLLPEENKYYKPLIKAYREMMGALLGFQGQDGMWHQLLDEPSSFAESSCTGMFLFAMATGLERGWLPWDQYAGPVQKSWEALAGYINEKGAVRDVCVGTNAKNNKKHYLTRPRHTGNFHGQAAVLWATTAMAKLKEKQV